MLCLEMLQPFLVVLASTFVGAYASATCTLFCKEEIEAEYHFIPATNGGPRMECWVYSSPGLTHENLNDNGQGLWDPNEVTLLYTRWEENACNENCWHPNGPVQLEDATSNLGTENFIFHGNGNMNTGNCVLEY